MSTAVVEHGGGNGLNDRAVTVRPHSVGVAAEQQRAIAEIQSALTVAQAAPRNEVACVDRVRNACQRVGLAEKAEYVYSRGGTDITGPTIKLLTVIANCWGNIQFGFRELTQSNGESTVEAFAWDLETNSKRTTTFAVPHKRVTKKQTITLTDPRDIYELVANQAQRRVRACLEAVIPPDVIEDAVDECRRTLAAKADISPDGLKKMVVAFNELGVTKAQIEARLGRHLDAIQPAQFLSMRRIYNSIKDGLSNAADWFTVEEAKPAASSANEAAKEALRQRMQQVAPTGTTAAKPEEKPAETPLQSPVESKPVESKPVEQPKPTEPVKPTETQAKGLTKATLAKLAYYDSELGEEFDVILQEYGVADLTQLSREQADAIIKRLHKPE